MSSNGIEMESREEESDLETLDVTTTEEDVNGGKNRIIGMESLRESLKIIYRDHAYNKLPSPKTPELPEQKPETTVDCDDEIIVSCDGSLQVEQLQPESPEKMEEDAPPPPDKPESVAPVELIEKGATSKPNKYEFDPDFNQSPNKAIGRGRGRGRGRGKKIDITPERPGCLASDSEVSPSPRRRSQRQINRSERGELDKIKIENEEQMKIDLAILESLKTSAQEQELTNSAAEESTPQLEVPAKGEADLNEPEPEVVPVITSAKRGRGRKKKTDSAPVSETAVASPVATRSGGRRKKAAAIETIESEPKAATSDVNDFEGVLKAMSEGDAVNPDKVKQPIPMQEPDQLINDADTVNDNLGTQDVPKEPDVVEPVVPEEMNLADNSSEKGEGQEIPDTSEMDVDMGPVDENKEETAELETVGSSSFSLADSPLKEVQEPKVVEESESAPEDSPSKLLARLDGVSDFDLKVNETLPDDIMCDGKELIPPVTPRLTDSNLEIDRIFNSPEPEEQSTPLVPVKAPKEASPKRKKFNAGKKVAASVKKDKKVLKKGEGKAAGKKVGSAGRMKTRGKKLDSRKLAGMDSDNSDDESDDDDDSDDWESEDDPEKLWCICKKPHNDKFMINCDGCDDWFHGGCVGITKKTGKEMEKNGQQWFCPNCKDPKAKKSSTEPKEKSPNEKQKADVSKKQPPAGKSESGKKSDKKRSNSSSGQKSVPVKVPQKCIVVKCPHMVRPRSIYCSDECIVKHADESLQIINSQNKKSGSSATSNPNDRVVVMERRTGKLLTGPNAPTQAELTDWLKENSTFEVLRPNLPSSKYYAGGQNAKSDPAKQTPKKSDLVKLPPPLIQGQPLPKREVTTPKVPSKTINEAKADSRKQTPPSYPKSSPGDNKHSLSRSNSTGSGGKRSDPPSKKPSTPSSPAKEKRRDSSSKSERKNEKPAEKPTPKVDPRVAEKEVRTTSQTSLFDALVLRAKETADITMQEAEIKTLAIDIEEAMYKLFNEAGPKYKNKYRSLSFNIKDVKNTTLFYKILTNEISPEKLVRMSAEEMARKELAQWRKRETQHSLDMIKKEQLEILTTPIIKKTHKGDVEIDNKERMKDQTNMDSLEAITGITVSPNKLRKLSGSQDKAARSASVSEAASQPTTSTAVDTALAGLGIISNDTTDEHSNHLFDLNCKICTGQVVPPPVSHPQIIKVTKPVLADQHSDSNPVATDSDSVSNTPPLSDKAVRVQTERDRTNSVTSIRSASDISESNSFTPRSDSFSTDQRKRRLSSVSGQKARSKSISPDLEWESEKGDELVWKGSLVMQDVADFDIAAFSVSGKSKFMMQELPKTITVCGRISPSQVWEYLSKIKRTHGRDLLVVRLEPPNNDEGQRAKYRAFYKYLSDRNRFGVVGNVADAVKDCYIIPLAAYEPVNSILLPFMDGPGLSEDGDKVEKHTLLGVMTRAKPVSGKRKSSISENTQPLKKTSISMDSADEPYDPEYAIITPSIGDEVKQSSTENRSFTPPLSESKLTDTSPVTENALLPKLLEKLTAEVEEEKRQLELKKQQVAEASGLPDLKNTNAELSACDIPGLDLLSATDTDERIGISLPPRLTDILGSLNSGTGELVLPKTITLAEDPIVKNFSKMEYDDENDEDSPRTPKEKPELKDEAKAPTRVDPRLKGVAQPRRDPRTKPTPVQPSSTLGKMSERELMEAALKQLETPETKSETPAVSQMGTVRSSFPQGLPAIPDVPLPPSMPMFVPPFGGIPFPPPGMPFQPPPFGMQLPPFPPPTSDLAGGFGYFGPSKDSFGDGNSTGRNSNDESEWKKDRRGLDGGGDWNKIDDEKRSWDNSKNSDERKNELNRRWDDKDKDDRRPRRNSGDKSRYDVDDRGIMEKQDGGRGRYDKDDRGRYDRDERGRSDKDDRGRYSKEEKGRRDDRDKHERDDRDRYERGERGRYERDDRGRHDRGEPDRHWEKRGDIEPPVRIRYEEAGSSRGREGRPINPWDQPPTNVPPGDQSRTKSPLFFRRGRSPSPLRGEPVRPTYIIREKIVFKEDPALFHKAPVFKQRGFNNYRRGGDFQRKRRSRSRSPYDSRKNYSRGGNRSRSPDRRKRSRSRDRRSNSRDRSKRSKYGPRKDSRSPVGKRSRSKSRSLTPRRTRHDSNDSIDPRDLASLEYDKKQGNVDGAEKVNAEDTKPDKDNPREKLSPFSDDAIETYSKESETRPVRVEPDAQLTGDDLNRLVREPVSRSEPLQWDDVSSGSVSTKSEVEPTGAIQENEISGSVKEMEAPQEMIV